MATSRTVKIKSYLDKHPTLKASQIAGKCGVSVAYVYQVKHELSKLKKKTTPTTHVVEDVSTQEVNHPPHYKIGGIETIDFIEAKGLNYHLGNVIKYITRADHKGNRKQDLEKAKWYLDREIQRL